MPRRFQVPERHKVECDHCYGHGCSYCGRRGWHESEEGRLEREAAEDERADAELEERALRRMEE